MLICLRVCLRLKPNKHIIRIYQKTLSYAYILLLNFTLCEKCDGDGCRRNRSPPAETFIGFQALPVVVVVNASHHHQHRLRHDVKLFNSGKMVIADAVVIWTRFSG